MRYLWARGGPLCVSASERVLGLCDDTPMVFEGFARATECLRLLPVLSHKVCIGRVVFISLIFASRFSVPRYLCERDMMRVNNLRSERLVFSLAFFTRCN